MVPRNTCPIQCNSLQYAININIDNMNSNPYQAQYYTVRKVQYDRATASCRFEVVAGRCLFLSKSLRHVAAVVSNHPRINHTAL